MYIFFLLETEFLVYCSNLQVWAEKGYTISTACTWELQLKLAEEIGLGNRNYNLIKVNIEKKEK